MSTAVWQGSDLLLQCYLQPRASRTEITGLHDGALRIRISAPPVDNAANKELIDFFAKQLKLPKRQITIESGATGRRKRLRLAGLGRLPSVLQKHLPDAPTKPPSGHTG